MAKFLTENTSSWMLSPTDPARGEIVRRAKSLGITGHPNKAAHSLGVVTLEDGRSVNVHVVHAVDPIITDGEHMVTILRSREPGLGKPCLPGGFIDPTKGGGPESAVAAAAREAMEECGIKLDPKAGIPVGQRNMDRPHDVRVAQADLPAHGIKKGDAFMVSTQGVKFHVPNLKQTKLAAGDDAVPGSATLSKFSELSHDKVGIPDHYDMMKSVMEEK